MLVVNTSTQLPLVFADDAESTMSVTRKRLTQVPAPDGERYGLIVAETPAEWEKDGGRLRRLIEGKTKSYVIIAPGPLLQQTSAEISAVGRALSAKPGARDGAPAVVADPKDDFLDGFVHKKLRAFVRTFSKSGGRDLYGFLMREVERPLIEFALAETSGNQRLAAELLGMNRNTLRKRMQECRLVAKEKKPRSARTR
ncbi:MAG: helix-turn-helix domain-containing protein [Nitrospiria bacterium]